MTLFRGNMLTAVLWLLAAAFLRADDPLLSARQIHRLSLKESAERVPVRLSGVITYVRGKGPGLVLQDATGGVMLEWPHIPQNEETDLSLVVGMLAEIRGYTITNPPTPRVYVTDFKALGFAPLPEPVEMTADELRGADLDGSFVTCEGVVRAASAEGDVIPSRLILELGPASGRLFIWVSRWTDETRRTFQPGSTIRVRGVFMRWKTVNWMPLVPFVVVNQPDWVEMTAPPPRFADVPLRPLRDLPAAAAEGDFSRMFRVEGTVTYADRDAVVIDDEGEPLWIRPGERDRISPGDRIEAVGHPGMNGPRAELEDAVVRKSGTGTVPAGIRLNPEDFENRGLLWMDGRRVKLRGTVSRGSPEPGEAPLMIRFGTRQVPVYFSGNPSLSELPGEGSVIEAEGVLEAGLSARLLRVGRGVGNHRLHVQSVADIRTILSGPWWTPARLTTAFFILTAVAGTAAARALILNRRVAEKSRALVQEISARKEQEIVLDERRRLAADLHDTLEQTLTGASLQLEALGSAQSPKPLVLARRLLDRSRDELRRAVWDLTPEAIGEKGFAAALEAIAAEQSERGVKATVSFSGNEGIVAERVAAHLCRVVQESVGNAVRHGSATKVDIGIDVNGSRVVLEVSDDGTGFLPAEAPGISSGHFGINGMKERMRRLGGSLSIESAPGEGTKVRAICPPRMKKPSPRQNDD